MKKTSKEEIVKEFSPLSTSSSIELTISHIDEDKKESQEHKKEKRKDQKVKDPYNVILSNETISILPQQKSSPELIKETPVNETIETIKINTKQIKKLKKPKLNKSEKVHANKVIALLVRRINKKKYFNKWKNKKNKKDNVQTLFQFNRDEFFIEGIKQEFKNEFSPELLSHTSNDYIEYKRKEKENILSLINNISINITQEHHETEPPQASATMINESSIVQVELFDIIDHKPIEKKKIIRKPIRRNESEEPEIEEIEETKSRKPNEDIRLLFNNNNFYRRILK